MNFFRFSFTSASSNILLLLFSMVILPLIHQILYKILALFEHSEPLAVLCGQSVCAYVLFRIVMRPLGSSIYGQISLKLRALLLLRSLIALGAHFMLMTSLNHFSLFYVNLASYLSGGGLVILSLIFLESFQMYKIFGLFVFLGLSFHSYTIEDYLSVLHQGLPFLCAGLFSLSSFIAKLSGRFCSPEDLVLILLQDLSWLSLGLMLIQQEIHLGLRTSSDLSWFFLIFLLGAVYASMHWILMLSYQKNALSTVVFFKPLRSLLGLLFDELMHSHQPYRAVFYLCCWMVAFIPLCGGLREKDRVSLKPGLRHSTVQS